MSYQVLARKWRPRVFAEMVGQSHVVQALSNALDNDRLHHAYLFTGTRGVGKTTLARIFSKSLNCEQGVSSTPCGQCSICTEIDEGRFVDLLEVDAASRTKVDQTRELLDNVPYAPVRGRYKVYLIDEVHMFSDSSFNALLKTLEEPPPHVKFLLATTDPQKVPVTVLSRCLQFNLKRLPLDQIQNYLQQLLDKESISYEVPALLLLAKGADGSMRDALSLLDQAIAFGAGSVKESEVIAMLGSIAQDHVATLLQALAQGEAAEVLERVRALAELAPDYRGVLQDMLSMLHRVALVQQVPGAIDNSAGDREQVEALAVLMAPEDVQLYYQIALTGQQDLPLAHDPQAGFEMLLLRMLAFRPAEMAERPAVTQTPQKKTPEIERPVNVVPATMSPAVTQDNSNDTEKALSRQAQPATEIPPSAPAFDNWQQVVEQLKLGGLSRQLANNCAFDSWDGHKLTLKLDAKHQNMQVESTEQRLQKALSSFAGCEVNLNIVPSELEQAQATPAKLQQQAAAERLSEAQASMASDPMVQELQAQMGAHVIPGSVKPVDSN